MSLAKRLRSGWCEIGLICFPQPSLALPTLHENCLNCFCYRRNCMSFAEDAVMLKLNRISTKIICTMPIRGFSASKCFCCFPLFPYYRALCRIVEIVCTIAELRALPLNLTVKRCSYAWCGSIRRNPLPLCVA